jgi:hypothetical protein
MDLLDSPFSRPFYFWLNSNLKVFVLISFNSKFHFPHYFRVSGQRSVRHSQYAYVVLEVAYITSTRNPNLLFLFVYLLILLRVYDFFAMITMKLIELNLQALETLRFHKELTK